MTTKNTMVETLARLTALAAALQTLQDNYGIRNEAGFNEQKGELADIIANIDIQPTAPPVTVDAVLDGLVARIGTAHAAVFGEIGSIYDATMNLGVKVDALIALANSAGEPAAA